MLSKNVFSTPLRSDTGNTELVIIFLISKDQSSGLRFCMWRWEKLALHCSFLSFSSMLNNKQSFSNVSLSEYLSTSDFYILFYKPFKACGFGAWVLWWLFREISEEPILLKSIFGGLNLLEIWPEDNGTLLYQNSHITSSPLQKTLHIAISYF